MSDFHQNGIITDFHNLTRRPVEALEAELVTFSARRPMSLILPSLFSELEGPALANIVDEIAQVPYLNEVVIGLDGADREHQPVSEDDPSGGLNRMSLDIAKALYRKLATQGVIFSAEGFRTLKATYYRLALDLIEAYDHDAVMNGLSLDRHGEERAVELFAANLLEAGNTFLDNPGERPFIHSWNRVKAAIPDLPARLFDAVEQDSASGGRD